MKAHILATTAVAFALAGCSTMQEGDMRSAAETATPAADIPEGTGYFAQESALPFHAPDFSRITDADYKPRGTVRPPLSVKQYEQRAARLKAGVKDGYFARVNPLDKAGAYGIQEHGERIIAGIRGNFDNVMGLPVAMVLRALG